MPLCRPPNFPRALQWRVFGWQYLRLSLIGLLASAGRIGQTLCLLYLLIAYSNPASSDSEVRPAGRRCAFVARAVPRAALTHRGHPPPPPPDPSGGCPRSTCTPWG